MADEQQQYTSEEITKLKVPDLKRELKLRGLNTSGNKIDLIQRLNEAMHGNKNDEGSVDSVEDELIDEDDVLNDDEIEDEVGNISNADEEDVNKTFETNSQSVKPFKRKTNSPKDKPCKKIVLKRASSAEATKPDVEIVYSSIDTNKTSNGSVVERKPIVMGLTMKEKLELRAKRFGTAATGTVKKEIHPTTFKEEPINVRSNKTRITFENDADNTEILKKRAERFGVVSTTLKKVDVVEKLEKRKERFGLPSNGDTATEDKKAKRLERFKITFN